MTELVLTKVFKLEATSTKDFQYGYYVDMITSKLVKAFDKLIIIKDGAFEVDSDGFCAELEKVFFDLETIGKDVLTLFVQELFLSRINVGQMAGISGDQIIKARSGVLSAAKGLVSDCWSFGKNTAYALRSGYDAIQQSAGLGKFETECGNLIRALDMIASARVTGGLVEKLTPEGIDRMSLEQLTVLRASVLTFLHNELLAIESYENMKMIRHNAGTTGNEWISSYKDDNDKTYSYTWLTIDELTTMKSYVQTMITEFTKYAPPTP